MADFDKNLQAIIKPTGLPLENIPIGEVEKLTPQTFTYEPQGDLSKDIDANALLSSLSKQSSFQPTGMSITNKELDENKRYKSFNPTISDYEDFSAHGQSWVSKGINGTLKGVNLAATTVAGGFAMVGGGISSIFTGRLADIWDNPMFQTLDEWNQKVDNEYLPNYYSSTERNSEWYERDNWMTANFLFDKLIKNSGYAVGAMYSGNIMNAGLLRLGSTIGKLASAAESAQAFKLFSPLLNSTARAFSAGKNLEAAAILDSKINSIADVANRTSKLLQASKTTGQFASFGDKGRRTLVALYSSGGESAFEALQTSNEYRERAIEEYINMYGQEPTGAALDAIEEDVRRVGKTSFLGNMVLLSVTEYAQLPYLLGSSYKNSRNAAAAMLGKADDVILKDGKYVVKGATTATGKAFEKARQVGSYLFDPKEAGQELGQYALQVGTQNYFNKAKLSNDASILLDGVYYGFFGKDEKGESVGALNSKEGIEGGILGGITGGAMQAIQKIGNAGRQKQINSKFIDNINISPTAKEALIYKAQGVNRGNVLLEEQKQAVLDGDISKSKDLKADLMFNYLSTRIKYGKTDIVMQELDDIMTTAATEQGLAELKEQGIGNINDTRAEFLERVSEVKEAARTLETLYNSINLTYGAKTITLPDGSKSRLYNEAILDRMAYAASKIVDYDKRIPEVSSSLISAGIDVQDIINEELTGTTRVALAKELIKLGEDSSLKDPSILQQELKDVVEMAKRRKQFVDEYKEFVNLPENFTNEGEPVNQDTPEGKKKRTVSSETTDKFSKSRNKFSGDKRTYDDLVKQFGQGETSKRDVLKKIAESPNATILERRLAEIFLKYTPKDSKIILGDRSIPSSGVSVSDLSSPTAAVSHINYEDMAYDYEDGDMVAEHVILHEIGHDLTTYALNDSSSSLRGDLTPIFNFVKDFFAKDPNKYAEAGLIRSGEFYGFTNIEEFTTEILSNREFQRYLSTIPYKNTQKSVWASFVEKIKKYFKTVFGITDENVLTELVAIISNNIDLVYGSTKEQVARLEQEEEALTLASESLEEEQDLIEESSGDIPTPPVENISAQEIADFSQKRKSYSHLFKSSTSESEAYANDEKTSKHIKNVREFFNKLKNFKNRSKLRAIILTSKQLEYLGLGSLIQASYKTDLPIDEIEGLDDVETGLIIQLYVIQEGKKFFYVDKDGNKLGELHDSKVNPADILFQTMPTTSLYYDVEQKNPKFRNGEEAKAKYEAEAYKIYRKKLFELGEKEFKISKFSVSRGIPIKNTVNGKRELNHVGSVLVKEDSISTYENLILISKDGKINYNEETLNFPKGVPVLKDDDTLQYLDNTTFTEAKATNLFGVIKAMADDIVEKALRKEKVTINRAYTEFLQNVLYWKSKDTASTSNQIYVNPITQKIYIGGNGYDFSDLEANKAEIIEGLTKAYFSVNEKTLSKKFNEPFTEFVTNADGTLDSIVWDNYQSFLLSATYPDKSARNVEDTPLVTSVAKPSEAKPYSFEQKYAILSDVEFPYKEIPKPEEVKPAPAPTNDVSEYVIDGSTVNEFSVFGGVVEFLARKTDTDTVEVRLLPFEDSEDTEELITAMIEQEKLMKESVFPILGKDPAEFDTMSEADKLYAAGQYITKWISTKLSKPAVPPSNGGSTPKTPRKNNRNFRKVGVADNSDRMTDRDIEVFKTWMSENLPQIPYEILDRIIRTEDGEKAWGVYVDGIAKFVKGGLKGTEYHEAFEAIWKHFLSQEEKVSLLDEFRNKPGQFTDRESGKKYNYDDPTVTDQMIKERIADDFSDFRLGKLQAKSLGQRILDFFRNILNFFKSFISKPSLQKELFEAINSGKFKERVSNREDMSIPEYRKMERISATEAAEYVQDMTANIAYNILSNNNKDLLYNPREITGEEIFDTIREDYEDAGIIEYIGENDWNELVKRTKQSLKTLGITVTTNDDVDFNFEDNNSRDYAPEPFSQDWKKTSSGAVKFMLATILKRETVNQKDSDDFYYTDAIESPNVKGAQLLSFNKVFTTLMDKLHDTASVPEFIRKLKELAEEDSNYVAVFDRLGGNLKDKTFDFSTFSIHDWRFFAEFFKVFTKQKPEAIIQYINNESVYLAPANIYTQVSETKRAWIETIKDLAKNPKSIISYNSNLGVYKIDAEKLKDIPIKFLNDKIAFLETIGISFPLATYKLLKTNGRRKNNSQTDQFNKAVSDIHSYLASEQNLLSIKAKTLKIDSPITKLAELYTAVTSPNLESTYFGIDGQRVNNYAENNFLSEFTSRLNEVSSLTELYEKMPQLNDVFSKNSQLLKPGGLLFLPNGDKIPDKTLNVKHISGTKFLDTDKGISSGSLKLGDRFVQEINANINGYYYALIAADGSTEWMVDLGNQVKYSEVSDGKPGINKTNKILLEYLSDEVDLALDYQRRSKLLSLKQNGQSLRFFRDILAEKDVKEIESILTGKAKKKKQLIDNYINDNLIGIQKSFKEYIDNTTEKTIETLIATNRVIDFNGRFIFKGLDSSFASDPNNSLDKTNLTKKELTDIITFVNTNYIINNIEYHKLMFGDPYQFAIKSDGSLDQTKRVKSFLSPRGRMFDTVEFNNFLNKQYNEVAGVQLSKTTPGYHDYKSYAKTATLTDNKIVGSLANIIQAYGGTEETDGFSWLMDNTYKEINLKDGKWSDNAEKFHQWQMAYTRRAFSMKHKDLFSYDGKPELKKHDDLLLSKPVPKHKIEVKKPIVSGNKANLDFINLALDKFAQMPIYYSMVEGKNLEKIYLKMFKEQLGYSIVQSGRKVGSEGNNPIYNSDGSFNENPYENTVDIPWTSYGIQVETASGEEEKYQTRGSQLTKLATVDLFENGEPIGDTPERKEYIKQLVEKNTEILDFLHRNAYDTLLKKWGVIDNGNEYVMPDGKAISETLKEEMLRRALSENAIDSIELDDNNQFRIPLEASNSYYQIRSILYSSINKALISPKMHGGAHVQVPTTMFEEALAGRSLAYKEGNTWVKIDKAKYDTLTEEQKKKVALTDDTLKFYEDADGKRYCEVLLPHWFKNKFSKKKFPTDESIMNYLNSQEGRKILTGIGFRIPTQALSSAEVFRVKGFLPQYMGATVVVPSEITTKAGSDFDIDKLSIYLKSVYTDANGNVRLVQYKNSEAATRAFYKNVYENTIKLEIEKVARYSLFRNKLFEILQTLENIEVEEDNDYLTDELVASVLTNKEDIEFYDVHRNILSSIFEQAIDRGMAPSEYIDDQITKLNKRRNDLSEKLLIEILEKEYVDNMYKKALENEYYASIEALLTLPENFKKLVSPVDDAGLQKLSEKLDDLKGYDENNIKARMLDRNYLTNLRHAFVMGKKWIGIAAVNITSLSIRQKSVVYIDPLKIRNLSGKDKAYLGDGKMLLEHNTATVNGRKVISLSGIYSSVTLPDGTKQRISSRLSGYATSFVDVAKNPYILKIIHSDLIVGVFMFLESVGTGIQGIMFLNQPIVSEYIRLLDSYGNSSLFSKAVEEEVLNMFPTSYSLQKVGVNPSNFESNISTYYGGKGSLSDLQNAEQQLIFMEFLKYAKMASFMFKFNQATNYDTTRFSSSDAFVRKQYRTFNAESTNIISSANNVLNSTFLGTQASLLDNSIEALSTVFKLDKEEFRQYTDEVLRKYAEDDFMSAEKFDKVANKIRMAFLDYIIQTKLNLNTKLKDVLGDSSKSVSQNLRRLKRKYPELDIIQELEVVSGDRIESANTITLFPNIKDPIEENRNVDRLREIRDYNREMNSFFQDLVFTAIFQGTYQTALSIRNIIPIEDYASLVSPIIKNLQPGKDLEAFSKGMFQRNNVLDPLAVPIYNPPLYFANAIYEDGEIIIEPDDYDDDMNEIYYFNNLTVFPFIPYLGTKSQEKQILTINASKNEYQAKNDYIKIPRIARVEIKDPKSPKLGAKYNVDLKFGRSMTKAEYAYRFAKGDPTLKDFFLYEKVYLPYLDENGNKIPLTTSNEKRDILHIYKRINSLGDGVRAGEWYNDPRKSVFKPANAQIEEMATNRIIEYFSGEALPDFKERLGFSEDTFQRTAGMITRQEVRSTPRFLYLFGDNDMRRGYGGQAAEMRDEANAIGISTKVSPNNDNSAFKTDSTLEKNKEIITQDINKVIEAWDSGKYVKIIVPKIGEGLADLPNKAPQTWEFLNQELTRLQEYVSPRNSVSLQSETETSPQATNLIDMLDQKGIAMEEWNSLSAEEQAQILKDNDLC